MINDLIRISREAGDIVKKSFNKNIKVSYKSNEKDLVTEVDRLSEKYITDFIKKKYPSHGILAEESGSIKEGDEYLWVIDPLDGTVNFAHGLPLFSISIGLRKNKQTIAGVIYDIMQDKMYSAEKGSGAYADSVKIEVTRNDVLGHALLVTGFPYAIAANPDNALGKFTALTMAARGIRRLGSAAIDLCYVARGIFDGFWEVYLNPWDMCAGKLIVEEAGGLVTDFDGNEMDIYSKRILATNGKIHKEVIEILKKN
jgi:myo-inositol-1(or 4)-monophosphatase